MKVLKNLFIFVIFFIFVKSCSGQNKILINEFLIDPQPQSVEIFNSGTENTNISDWIIDDSGGTTFYTIPKDSIILPNQCLVFSADFNLNKTSADTVKLINNSQLLIDSFSYKSSSGSGISYYRFPDNNNYWTTGLANLGFYNQTNLSCLIAPTPIPTLIPTLIITSTMTPEITERINPSPTSPTVVLTEVGTPTLTPQSYDNIYLSEAMVNPATGEKEWVEIYNDNDFPVSLNNWYIDDLENAGSSPKIFSIDLNAKGYGILDLTSSIFNNDGDRVRLLDFNKNLKDDFEYEKSETGKTLGRTSFESDDFCIQEPSYNFANNPCINPTPTMTSICTGQACLTPTMDVIVTKILTTKSTPSNKPVSIDQLARRNLDEGGLINTKNSGQVLGTTNELIINSHNNSPLINFLSILSVSYSLLTISSILFKMKLSYGKNKNFYSSSLHSS